MLKQYVRFRKKVWTENAFLGYIDGYQSMCEDREIEDGKPIVFRPFEDGIYAICLFEQNVEVRDDGEVIFGKKENFSRLYYFGEGPYTKTELSKKLGQEDDTELLTMHSRTKEKKFIILANGDTVSLPPNNDYNIVDSSETYIEKRETGIYVHNQSFSFLYS